MQIGNLLSVRRLAVASALLTGLASTPAGATTINSYTFVQDAYQGTQFTGTLSGSFTGAVDVNGFMNLADLTDFHVKFDLFPVFTLFGNTLPTFFSFNIAPNHVSSLTFIDTVLPATICVGAAADFFCSGNNATGAVQVAGALLQTTSFPVITLVSSVATTPIPSTVWLFLSALGGLGWTAWHRRGRELVQSSVTARS